MAGKNLPPLSAPAAGAAAGGGASSGIHGGIRELGSGSSSGGDSDSSSSSRNSRISGGRHPSGRSRSSGSSGSSSGSSTSSRSSRRSGSPVNALRFRRIDSDDDAGAVADKATGGDGHRRSVAGDDGTPGLVAGVVGVAPGAAAGGGRRTTLAGDDRAALRQRMMDKSKKRVRDALLARDPGGYKRALADKHSLEFVFDGLTELGDIVASAKEQGMDDIAFVLDEERRESRRKLMDALALEDEGAAIKGVLAVSAQIDEAFATWRAFESESREEKLAAHARLPFWKRPFDLDKDGHVSFQEKRFIVTITLLILTTIACVVLVGLLTKHFVDSRINPLTSAEFKEEDRIKLPSMSFCVKGPSFASLTSPSVRGLPLFDFDHYSLPPSTTVDDNQRERIAPTDNSFLAELPRVPEECASGTASLTSEDNNLNCVFCYELKQTVSISRGATAEENVRSDLQLQFSSFQPFIECLTQPSTIQEGSLSKLRDLVEAAWQDLVVAGVLAGVSGQEAALAQSMSSAEACNVYFWSGHFYPRRSGEERATFTRANDAWTPSGMHYNANDALPDFARGVEIHILDFSSRNSSQQAHDHRSIPGFPVGNASPNVLTQILLNKRTISHRLREGTQRTRSEDLYRAKVDYYPRVFPENSTFKNFFFLSIAIDNFIVESYSHQPTYTVPMFLEQLLGYFANFFGVSVFTLVVVPMILALSSRDKARTLRASVEELDEEAGDGGEGGGGRRSSAGRRRSSLGGGGGGGGGDGGGRRRTSALGTGAARGSAEIGLAFGEAKPRISERFHPRSVFSGLLGGAAGAQSGRGGDGGGGGDGDGGRRLSTGAGDGRRVSTTGAGGGGGGDEGGRRSSVVGVPVTAAIRTERQAKRISEYQRNYSAFRRHVGDTPDDGVDDAAKRV